jgi:hypothetical protein
MAIGRLAVRTLTALSPVPRPRQEQMPKGNLTQLMAAEEAYPVLPAVPERSAACFYFVSERKDEVDGWMDGFMGTNPCARRTLRKHRPTNVRPTVRPARGSMARSRPPCPPLSWDTQRDILVCV